MYIPLLLFWTIVVIYIFTLKVFITTKHNNALLTPLALRIGVSGVCEGGGIRTTRSSGRWSSGRTGGSHRVKGRASIPSRATHHGLETLKTAHHGWLAALQGLLGCRTGRQWPTDPCPASSRRAPVSCKQYQGHEAEKKTKGRFSGIELIAYLRAKYIARSKWTHLLLILRNSRCFLYGRREIMRRWTHD